MYVENVNYKSVMYIFHLDPPITNLNKTAAFMAI